MDANDQRLLDANWQRMRAAISTAASEYRQLADALESIRFTRHDGEQRPTSGIIGQVAYAVISNRIGADLVQRLALWSETIDDLQRHAATQPDRCGIVKSFGEDSWTCVLSPGHSGPERKGVLAHITASGSEFYA